MLASTIGATRRIEIKEGWREPCIIWTTIIGESGTKKSPPLEKAIAPLMRRQRDAIDRYYEFMAAYEQEKLRYDKSLAQWKRSLKNTNEPPTPSTPPTCVRYVVDDCTIEAIVSVLQSNPRGVLLGVDELSQWLRGFSEYKSGRGGDTPKWLKIFNGRNLVVDRKTNVRLMVVPRAHVSLCGGIQSWVLQKELGTEHFADGLASRLLLALPPPRRSPWKEVGIPDRVRDKLDAIVGRLLTLEPGVD